MHKRFLIFFLLILALAGAAFFLLKESGGGADGETATVQRGEAVQAVYATGVVEPTYWAKLGPQKTGRLPVLAARAHRQIRIVDGRIVP